MFRFSTGFLLSARVMSTINATSVHDFTVRKIDGTPQKMAEFKGQPLLIVNTASNCGLTPQYAGLEALSRDFKGRLTVLGFPSDDFNQEPDTDAEIQGFCSAKFDVTFPLMAKLHVNGDEADPLFKFLKSQQPGLLGIERIQWNFAKFYVSGSGQVVARFAPTTTPDSMRTDIEKLLADERK